jgi:hypothetical protein
VIARACLVVIAGLLLTAPASAARHAPPGLPPASPCGTARTCVHVQIFSYIEDVFDGSGTVTSSPAGVDCRFEPHADHTGSCDVFIRSVVDSSLTITLTATPDVGNKASFECPPAGCTATFTGTSSYFEMDAGFRRDRHALTITKSGNGAGSVTSIPPLIDCGPLCANAAPYGTSVALVATAQAPSTFAGWSGACAGQPATCVLKITGDVSVEARFELPAAPGGGGSSGGGTGGGSGGGSTGGAGPVTPPAATDKTLDAQLVAVRTARSKLGARIVVVELTADEEISVDVALRRGTKVIASRHVVGFAAQDGTIVVPIPRTTKAGVASLSVTLTDAKGNASLAGRTLRLPKVARR